MYRFSSGSTNKNSESIEASLRDSIRINPIQNKQNPFCHPSLPEKNVKNQSKNSKKDAKPYKGKLIKSSLRNKKSSESTKPKPELKTKQTVVRKEKTTLSFIDKLKEIEKVVDNDNFLDQTNEEIDIASKQLEALQKLLTNKLEKSTVQETRSTHRHHHENESDYSKEFERLQKRYMNKTKNHFKSLKDFENLTYSKKYSSEPNVVREPVSEENQTKHIWTRSKVRHAPKNTKEPVDKNHIETQTTLSKSFSSGPFTLEEKKRVPQSILKSSKSESNNNNQPTRKFTRFSKYSLQTRLADIPEFLTPPESVASEESSGSELEYPEDLKLVNNIFVSRKFKENNQNQADAESLKEMRRVKAEVSIEDTTPCNKMSFEDDPKEFLLNAVLSEPGVMPEKYISSSDYLSKEFPIDITSKFVKVDKAGERRSMQLLENTQGGKFERTCRMANLKRRDQKLYTTLNMALKDTLYGEIRR